LIALDANGDLSGACTTSGMAFKMRRLGDSPIIGAGLYVDNEIGAATGHGEEVISYRLSLGRRTHATRKSPHVKKQSCVL
jgi:isoaspartyl peptidase/L-asparaginase-like protein (Ntn-hydrolase superfamily)